MPIDEKDKTENSEQVSTSHVTDAKESYIHGEYPLEDRDTEMFDPFFKRKRTWMVIASMVLFFGILTFLQPDVSAIEKLDQSRVTVGLSIFACIAFLWLTEAMPLAVTSLFVPILASVMGVFSVKEALANFAHPLIFIFLGGMALASALAYQGIDKFIANRIVLASKGNIGLAAIYLFLATAVLSMWMSNTATTAMMIPLILGIVGQLTIKDETLRNRTAIFFLLGVAYSASIGGMGTIVGSPPNGIAAKQMGVSFAEWMKFGIPCVVVLLPVMILVLWLVLKPHLSEKIEVERLEFKWTKPRKMTLLIFAVTALSWVFSKKLAPFFGITKSFDTLVALIAIFMLIFFRVVRWRDIDKSVDWGVLMLFGGGITLSSVVSHTGASVYLASLFAKGVSGLSILMLIGSVCLFVIFLTELSSNTATTALFVPIFYAVGLEMNLNPSLLVLTLALSASCAFMLPVATPPNAIVFGTGMVPQKTMMRVGFVLNLVMVVALTLLVKALL